MGQIWGQVQYEPLAGNIQVAKASRAWGLYPSALCGLIWLYSFLHYLIIIKRIEDLPFKHLVSQGAIETLIVTVLPGTSRFDEQRFNSDLCQPFADLSLKRPGESASSTRACSIKVPHPPSLFFWIKVKTF